MTDFKRAHDNMLFRQFLPNKLTDERLIHAFQEVWREKFMPSLSRPLSYCDQNVPLPIQGRKVLSFLSLMRLLQVAGPQKDSRVLSIASGTGFGAVVLSYLAELVVCLEADDALYLQVLDTIKQFASSNLIAAKGSFSEGFSPKSPYDLIIIEGAVVDVPLSLLGQLTEGGKCFAYEPLFEDSSRQLSRAVCYERHGKTYTKISLFEAIAPRLEAFDAQKKFQL